MRRWILPFTRPRLKDATSYVRVLIKKEKVHLPCPLSYLYNAISHVTFHPSPSSRGYILLPLLIASCPSSPFFAPVLWQSWQYAPVFRTPLGLGKGGTVDILPSFLNSGFIFTLRLFDWRALSRFWNGVLPPSLSPSHYWFSSLALSSWGSQPGSHSARIGTRSDDRSVSSPPTIPLSYSPSLWQAKYGEKKDQWNRLLPSTWKTLKQDVELW